MVNACIRRLLYDERSMYSYGTFHHLGVEMEWWVEISKLGNPVEWRGKKITELGVLFLWLCKLRGVSGSWKETVYHTQCRRTDIYGLIHSSTVQWKQETVHCTQRRVQIVALSEFIEDDMKKLFRCFIMCGRVINTRLSHQEESAVRDQGAREGDDAAIKRENLSL